MRFKRDHENSFGDPSRANSRQVATVAVLLSGHTTVENKSALRERAWRSFMVARCVDYSYFLFYTCGMGPPTLACGFPPFFILAKFIHTSTFRRESSIEHRLTTVRPLFTFFFFCVRIDASASATML